MTRIDDLAKERTQLEEQLTAQKAAAVAEVTAAMEKLGLTWQDFGVAPVTGAKPTGVKRTVKYRDDKGNTWTGVGQRPRWLTQALLAGKQLDEFKVR